MEQWATWVNFGVMLKRQEKNVVPNYVLIVLVVILKNPSEYLRYFYLDNAARSAGTRGERKMDSHKCQRCGCIYSFLVMTYTIDMGWFCDECIKTLVEEGSLVTVEIPISKKGRKNT